MSLWTIQPEHAARGCAGYGAAMDVAAAALEVAERGYTIVADVLSPAEADSIAAELVELEARLGITPSNNAFEGRKTTRVYNLLAHGSTWEQIPVHPKVLPIVDAVLDPGCLVSSLSSIAIHSGERAQPLHADDQLQPLPRPHVAVICNTMWALTDFTDANGATRIVPGSHLHDAAPDPRESHHTIPAEMTKGSVLVWHGSLWHGGGANTTDSTRIGIAMNYCAGWLRQQENQQLGLSLDRVRTFAPRLQELCGFGVYHGLIGHVDRQTPKAALLDGVAHTSLFDPLSTSR